MIFEVFILFAIVAAIAIGFTSNRNQQVNRAWSQVAQMLDLSLRHAALGTSPQLSGFVEGHDLTVDIQKKHKGNHRSPQTRFRLGMPAIGLGLKLSSEGFFDGIKKALGAQDIEVGDPGFDSKVRVQGHNEPVTREYLNSERRRTIQHFLSSFSGAVITDDEITLSSRGYVRSADELIGTIRSMLFVAQTLAEVRDDAEPDSEYAQLNEPTPISEEQLADDIAEPEDSVITESETPAEPLPAALSSPAGSPAVTEFCDAVFAPGTLSFDATRNFKESFEGKRVVWSGTLASASPFTFDINFGSKGGVKAVLVIHSDGSGPTGTRDIKAIIALPAGTEGLDNRIGERVSFAGTLHKVEGFARKVVLTDAELSR